MFRFRYLYFLPSVYGRLKLVSISVLISILVENPEPYATHLWPFFSHLHGGSQPTGVHLDVVVQQGHVLRPPLYRIADARVVSRGPLEIPPVALQPNAGEVSPDELHRPVGRSVVDDHQFIIRIVGRQHRGQGVFQMFLAVPVEEQDAHERERRFIA